MKNLFVITALILTTVASGSTQPRNIISVGTDGFGWNGVGEVFDWNSSKSGIKSDKRSSGSLKLNYNYVFENRVMLGGEIDIETANSQTKFGNQTNVKNESAESRVGISVGHNFNPDLFRSWWVRGILGSGQSQSETRTTSQPKLKKKFDYGYLTLSGGKRFSLESWGLKNVSYNPSIAITSASGDGTDGDKGLDGFSRAVLDIIRVDILF